MNGAPAFVRLRNRRTGKTISVPWSQLANIAMRRGSHDYEPAGQEPYVPSVPQPVHPMGGTNYQPAPEGVPNVPVAEWEQRPEGVSAQFTNPSRAQEVRWGDMRTLPFDPNAAGPAVTKSTLYLLNQELQIPAVVMLRLSAVETTGAITTPSANDVATFTVQFGCGAALQEKKFQIQVGPANGSANTDVVLTVPAQVLRVSCDVTVVSNVAAHQIDTVAMVAPFTSYPELVR